jgi:hypothetical protein
VGWCAEFGCQIRDGCDHSMVAGKKACTCPTCAVVCKGRFGGCPEVWAAGPRAVAPPVVRLALAVPLAPTPDPPAPAARNGPAAPAPPAPAVDPLPEQVTSALATIRSDVEGVHLDLGDTIIGLKEIRDAVDELTRTTTANVEALRRELSSVRQLLAEQQTALNKLVDSQASAIGARSSYEKLVEERRQRMAAAGVEDTTGLRGLLPRIQRTLHSAHSDHDPPPPAPEREADGPKA